jgi:hypothetical protein
MKSRDLNIPAPSQFVVQFPHPGREHNPGNARRQPWNIGDHRRKFLCSPGRFVSEDGSLSDGTLVFWGEWEPPSNIIQHWRKKDFLPLFLHEPVWERPPAGGMLRQNTDPWVFGDSFRFSNCQQLRKGRPSALQRLTPGSLVLFGSAKRKRPEFTIDTVFVVKDSRPFSPGKSPKTDEAFRVCTVESLLTTGNADDPFTLYRGATYEARINGMYSFVPCRRANAGEPRFSRPSISLPGYVNPKSTQSASGANSPRSATDVCEQWENVRRQVLEAGCALGVWFATPPSTGNSETA